MINNENQVLHLISDMPETVNHYTGIRVMYKQGKPLPIVYETKAAKDYKKKFIKHIKEEVEKQNWEKVENKYHHLYMDGIFYMPKTNIDAANCDKILSDAITGSGVVWDDDSGLLFRPQRIYYDKENPRIELTIHPVEYVGIFGNQCVCDAFEEHCKTCNRYPRNCSILRKAKEGRIQSEIYREQSEIYCSKYKFKKTEDVKGE